MPQQRLTVGVIGGVGPQATVCFMDAVVQLTAAGRDQEHVDMVVMQHASIPDRTAFVLGRSTDDPGPVMAADAAVLDRLGVGFIVVPCNTAHVFVDQVVAAASVPVVSIVGETVAAALARNPGLRTAGVMATSGTLASGVYQRELAAAGVAALVPDDEHQAILMSVIYDQVKGGAPVDMGMWHTVVDHLRARGAEVMILGCTELSVVAADEHLLADASYVDSLDALARRTVVMAGGRLRG